MVNNEVDNDSEYSILFHCPTSIEKPKNTIRANAKGFNQRRLMVDAITHPYRRNANYDKNTWNSVIYSVISKDDWSKRV